MDYSERYYELKEKGFLTEEENEEFNNEYKKFEEKYNGEIRKIIREDSEK